jgi:hypothetical protein
MSFTLDLVVNPVILLGAVVFGVLFGYFLFRTVLSKRKAKIHELEMELMQSNEETLEAQRAYVMLESKFKDQQTSPVIPMKITANKENSKEKASK